MTFREFLMIDEGQLLPDKSRWKGMSRINPLPCTNAERRKLMPKKPPKVEPFKPTVAAVGKPPKLHPPQPYTPRERRWGWSAEGCWDSGRRSSEAWRFAQTSGSHGWS